MARGSVRLSGTQIRRLWDEVIHYAEESDISIGDVVLSVNPHSGVVVLTDYDWDKRETSGKHTEFTPKQKTVERFRATMVF